MGFKWIKWMFFLWRGGGEWFVAWFCGGWGVCGGGIIKKQFPRGWETAFAI